MKEKKKSEILFNDLLILTPLLLIALVGFVALLFIGGFSGFCSLVWLVKCFSLPTAAQQWGGFFVALLTLLCTAFFAWLACYVVKRVFRALDVYLLNRKKAADGCERPAHKD